MKSPLAQVSSLSVKEGACDLGQGSDSLSWQHGVSGEVALQEVGEGLGVTHPALGDRGEPCPTALR